MPLLLPDTPPDDKSGAKDCGRFWAWAWERGRGRGEG